MLTIDKATIECPHCTHALEGIARFLIDIIKCSNCGKFVKIETFARVQRVVPQRSTSTYVEVVDYTEPV